MGQTRFSFVKNCLQFSSSRWFFLPSGDFEYSKYGLTKVKNKEKLWKEETDTAKRDWLTQGVHVWSLMPCLLWHQALLLRSLLILTGKKLPLSHQRCTTNVLRQRNEPQMWKSDRVERRKKNHLPLWKNVVFWNAISFNRSFFLDSLVFLLFPPLKHTHTHRLVHIIFLPLTIFLFFNPLPSTYASEHCLETWYYWVILHTVVLCVPRCVCVCVCVQVCLLGRDALLKWLVD